MESIGIEEMEKLQQHVLKSQCIRQAVYEVIGEHRQEIVERAAAKLTALGVEISKEDLGVIVGTTPL